MINVGKVITSPRLAQYFLIHRSKGKFGMGGWVEDADYPADIYLITKTGSTINVDCANNRIAITPGGTVTGIRTKTLAAIKTELEALGCTVTEIRTGLSHTILGNVMIDSGGAQATPYAPKQLIPNAQQPITARGIIVPANDKELLHYPEADRIKGAMTFYSTAEMFVTRTGNNSGLSDEIEWRGNRYSIDQVGPFADYGYWKAIGQRIEGD